MFEINTRTFFFVKLRFIFNYLNIFFLIEKTIHFLQINDIICKISGRNVTSGFNLKQLLLRRIPILAWIPQYSLSKLLQDILAGLTVGLTVIPQGIAYAIVAGLPAQVCTFVR